MYFTKTIFAGFYIIFLLNSSFCQKIDKGTYQSFIIAEKDPVTHADIYFYSEYYESINVINDSLFEYKYWCDVGSDIGHGYYQLFNDNFILNFTNEPEKFDTTSFKILRSEPSKGDSILFQFLIIDAIDLAPIKNVIIATQNCDTAKVRIRNKFACETGDSGIGRLKIPKNLLPCEIYFTVAGYHSFKINSSDNSNKTIEIRLKYYSSFIPKGTVIKYLVKDINRYGFYLFGGIWTKWTFFRKMD